MKRTNRQSGSRRKYYARYLAHYTKQNVRLLLLGGLFVLGVALGTLLVRSAGRETIDLLLRLIGDFMAKRREQSLMDNFISGITGPVQLLAVVFVSGFCAIGQPITLGVPLFRGLGFGFSAASLYASYGGQAVGFVALFMLPGTILSTIALLFCCNESLRLSGSLWTQLGKGEGEVYSVRIYCARYVAALLFCLLTALFEAVLYTLFSGIFVL